MDIEPKMRFRTCPVRFERVNILWPSPAPGYRPRAASPIFEVLKASGKKCGPSSCRSFCKTPRPVRSTGGARSKATHRCAMPSQMPGIVPWRALRGAAPNRHHPEYRFCDTSFHTLRMRSAHRFLQILQGQVGVEFGASDLGIPQDGLDVP